MTAQMIETMIRNMHCLNDPDYGFLVDCLDQTSRRKALSYQDYLRLETLAKNQRKVYNISTYQGHSLLDNFDVHFDKKLENRYAGDHQVMGRTPAPCICVF